MQDGRRLLLQTAARVAALTVLAPHLPAQARSAVNGAYPFSLGVASGAPLPDSVILWTRLLPDPLNAASMPPIAQQVRWEVAHDEAFTRIAARGSAVAAPALAHCVHVDVRGLEPDRWYWYRFMLGDAVSPIGRTRTAPAPGAMPGALKLAVASCQHWEFGHYAAHRHIARAAPDLVAFLGDYIYEWGPYSLQHPATALRRDESFSLAEYRARYAQYKSDADLQAAHHAAPWVVTWDDHEVANDYSPNRDELLSADFVQRRAAAYQAFFEHQPVRAQRIYQRYDWGRLARFHVLDTRQYRSQHACQPAGRGGSTSVYRRACAALADPRRTMLGVEQERWLAQGLKESKASWNIVAQQTLMAQLSQVPLASDSDGRFWTDGWDGYAAARKRLLDAMQAARNPLVLSGDVHTFFAAELRRDPSRPASAGNPLVATEFCGTSITSSSRPQARTQQYVDMNRHLKFGQSDKRGYMLLELRPERATMAFEGLENVRDPRSASSTLARFSVADGVAGPKREA
ncbi:alkaline phosphatase [Pseudoduganella sp. DS3]|uniref:Alkaline phosphatase n=1 Tax=Pseudoduganella guangdongensis TaxID=2692179 RepID=A0A6N9HAG4_9BURK|nr:alkaline phosphatase D family protein [Pseudoduganella guangdongensis]MYN00488.1 alkaline phosphatase [Pseudoduganella guangdongensis]